MSVPVVEIENLVKRYQELVALDHFNLTIEEGEIFGLLGPNGSGKTTTINCILALLAFDKGTVRVFGQEMRPDSYDLKRQIGVVMQNVAVFQELTVYENIDYFCGLYIRDKALRRRLNIACGIAHKPKLIILDEPTVAVDPQSRNKILEGIQELNRNGATIIYTSHYMEEVEQICTRIAIMDKGKNLAIGTTEELKRMIKKSEIISIDILDLLPAQIAAIRDIKHVYEVTFEHHCLKVLCSGGSHNLPHILNYLQEQNVSFGRVYSELPTLNDVFLEITGKELRD